MTSERRALCMLNLESDYRSDRADLVEDFYVPALAVSTHYDRAVGYFSASVLAVLGQGLDGFASRGGQLRIVASPQLNQEDVAQIRAGYALRAVLERAALRNIEDACQDPVAAHGLGQLGALVAEGRLDIKLAYISADNRIGIYHEKIGVFCDGRDVVAFKGSANETLPGLAGNFESVEVFRSWHASDSERAVRISRDFEDLWEDRTPLLRVFDFTDAARPLIEEHELRTKGQTAPQVPTEGATITLPWPDADGMLTIPPDLQVRDYQKEAVRRWFAQGLRGILRMATGTGKTLTALSAAAQLAKRLKRKADLPLLTVIVVPYQHLVDQWAQDIDRFGIPAIRAYESTDAWYRRASYLMDALTLGAAHGGVIVTTNATLSRGGLQALLDRYRGHLLVIGDEVHNLGARRVRGKLPGAAAYRLGLSATPERWFDDDGTAALQEYFGDVVFEMGIGDAIKAGALCRYTYAPVLVELDAEEAELYAEVTEKIARALASQHFADDSEDDSPLGRLLRKRANILGHARAKLPALRREIAARQDGWFQLLYCAEGRHPLADGVNGDLDEPTQLDQALHMVGQELRMPAAKYISETPREQRRAILRRFSTGNDLQALLSMRCLDEGVDVPAARTAYLLASSSNPRQFIQRRGRVLRRAPGKDMADIVDFIVVPPDGIEALHRETERRMIARELSRVTEFARLADNEAATLDVLRPLRQHYGLMDT
ncbi:DEAD/DEAH box helicase family protein [Streptomyces sp. MP131-18]|uniref:DEAD/DEAH box helicase family protein n=1 Tax=Streptomyces sp. MP131-18 TaxID=1857892 RepID=UPI00097C6766|nr:DEAD/DEAH box helicase family protein [Streptomyces sp. MP131-18]ONK12577.1 UvsW helicase [Streptomyces sp. MP131-18]